MGICNEEIGRDIGDALTRQFIHRSGDGKNQNAATSPRPLAGRSVNDYSVKPSTTAASQDQQSPAPTTTNADLTDVDFVAGYFSCVSFFIYLVIHVLFPWISLRFQCIVGSGMFCSHTLNPSIFVRLIVASSHHQQFKHRYRNQTKSTFHCCYLLQISGCFVSNCEKLSLAWILAFNSFVCTTGIFLSCRRDLFLT